MPIIPFESEFEKTLKQPIGKPEIPKPKFPTRGPVTEPPDSTGIVDFIPTGDPKKDINRELSQKENIDQLGDQLHEQQITQGMTGAFKELKPFSPTQPEEMFQNEEIDSNRSEMFDVAQSDIYDNFTYSFPKGTPSIGPAPIEGRSSLSPEAGRLKTAQSGLVDFLPGKGPITAFDQELKEIRQRINQREAELTARETASFRERIGGILGSLFIFEDAALEGAVDLIQGRGVKIPTPEGIKQGQEDFNKRPLKEQVALSIISPSKAALGEEALRVATRSTKEAAKLAKESGALDEVKRFLDEETGAVGSGKRNSNQLKADRIRAAISELDAADAPDADFVQLPSLTGRGKKPGESNRAFGLRRADEFEKLEVGGLEARFAREAAERKSTPGPAPGHVRLYRGQGPEGSGFNINSEASERGLWFSRDLKKAREFGSNISFVDVPEGEVRRLQAQMKELDELSGSMTRDVDTLLVSPEIAKGTKQIKGGLGDATRAFASEETGASFGQVNRKKTVTYTDPEIKEAFESPSTIGRRFIGDNISIADRAAQVSTVDNKALQLVLQPIAPNMAKNTDLGRIVVAHTQNVLANRKVAETAVIAAVDSHAKPFAGNLSQLVPINEKGIWKGTPHHIMAILEKPSLIKLDPRQKEMFDDMQIVLQELQDFRAANGLTPMVRETNGTLYFPRQVKDVDGVRFRTSSNPRKSRLIDDADEGMKRGVNYDGDFREVLKLHITSSLKEAEELDFARSLKPHSMTARNILQKMKPEVVEAYKSTVAPVRRQQNLIRALSREKDLLTTQGPSPSAKNLRRARNQKILALEKQIAEAKEELVRLDRIHNKARKTYIRESDRIRNTKDLPGKYWGKDQGGNIEVGEWHKSFFPIEGIKHLEEAQKLLYPGKVGKGYVAAETLGNAIRTSASTLDAALPLTHGLPILARRPDVWAKGSLYHYWSFFNPAVGAKFIRKNIDDANEFVRLQGDVGRSEFHAVLQQGGSIDRFVRDKVPAGKLIAGITRVIKGQTLGRFQAMYDNGLLIYRVEMFKALKEGWKDSRQDLAKYIANMSGGLDASTVGIGVRQQKVESMLLAWSPKLLRSTTALTGDALAAMVKVPTRGKLGAATAKQRQSFQAMATLTSAILGFTAVIGLALNKSEEEIRTALNPLSGKKFCSYQINGDWVGCGGQVRAIIQAMMGMASALAPGGKPIEDIVSLDMQDNPLLNLWSSRGALGVSLVGATIEGTTGLNALKYDQIDTRMDIVKHIGTTALPFTAKGHLEGEKPFTVTTAFAGARTSPQTFQEARDEGVVPYLRSKGLPTTDLQGEPLTWKDLPPRERAEIDVSIDKKRKDPQQTRIEDAVAAAFETSRETKQRVAEKLAIQLEGANPIDARKSIQAARKELFNVNNAVFDERVKKSLAEQDEDRTILESLRIQHSTASGEGTPDTNDNWYKEQQDVREQILNQARGVGILESWVIQRAKLTEDVAVQAMLDLYDRDQELLGPYWESPSVIIREQLNANGKIVWDDYLDSNRARQAILSKNPGISKILEQRSKMRIQYRAANPQVDMALIQWGYVSTAVTVEGQELINALTGFGP